MSSISEQRRELSPREAREQAAEATGFLASAVIKIGEETFEVPQRGLLDDEQREKMDALELETEGWQREPDVMVKLPDGTFQTRPGPLKLPYRDKDGKQIKPSYPVRVAVALWGQAKYDRFKKGGGRATDVTATLARLDKRLEDRASDDPKSVSGDSDVEPVSD